MHYFVTWHSEAPVVSILILCTNGIFFSFGAIFPQQTKRHKTYQEKGKEEKKEKKEKLFDVSRHTKKGLYPFYLNHAQSAHCCTLYFFLPSQMINWQYKIRKHYWLLYFCKDIFIVCSKVYYRNINKYNVIHGALSNLSRHSIILVKIMDPVSFVVDLYTRWFW